MRKQENYKVFIIVLSYALANPYAVMIKSAYTFIANSAMFASSWFNYIASLTDLIRFIEYFIIIFLILFLNFFTIFRGYHTRANCTCSVKNIIAKYKYKCPTDCVNMVHVRSIAKMFENSKFIINSKSWPKYQNIENLTNRVVCIKNIVIEVLHFFINSFSKYFSISCNLILY